MTDNNTIIPSTPSWMTDQRNSRRVNARRGYGRRFSISASGGTRSTNTKASRLSRFGELATLRGSALNFNNNGDDGSEDVQAEVKEEDNILNQSAHARVQGNRGRARPPRTRRPNGWVDNLDQSAVDILDQSAHARLETRLNLTDKFDHNSRVKAKKKRLNLRPPRPAKVAAGSRASRAASTAGASSQLFPATPKADHWNEPKADLMNSAASSAITVPILILGENGASSTPIAPAKRSKIMTNNATAAKQVASQSSKALHEENVHPNDITETPINAVIGTRRSSRLASRRNSHVAAETKPRAVVTMRSRAKANSKKRSATSAGATPFQGQSSGDSNEQLEPHDLPSPPKTARCATSSLKSPIGSAGSRSGGSSANGSLSSLAQPFSSSRDFSTMCTPANNNKSSSRIDSLSNLDRLSSSSHDFSTATPANNNNKNKSSTSSSANESFSTLAQRSSSNNWASGKKMNHKRSVSISVAASSALKTPSTASSLLHQRSTSCSIADLSHGNRKTPNKRSVSISVAASSALKTPSTASSLLHQRSMSCSIADLSHGNRKTPAVFTSPSFLSPTRSTTNLSTPSELGSTPSRKRRTMDFTGSSLLDEDDFLGVSERRLKKSPPMVTAVPFMIDQDASIREDVAPASVLKTDFSSSKVLSSSYETQYEPMDIFSPPPTLSFGKQQPLLLNDEMSFFMSDCDTPADEKKLDDTARDHRLSFGVDKSMMSTESSDDENDSTAEDESSNDDEYDSNEDEEDEEIPRPKTDSEIFQSKSSYDDFKFLTKSLQKWSQSSAKSTGKGNGMVASMGLHNGCLIAVPPSWTFDHRANFGKWVATSFRFRVGSVGGADRGSFLRCSDAEGNEVLERLRQMLVDYKAGRLVEMSTPAEKTTVADKKMAECASRNDGKLGLEKKTTPMLPIKLSLSTAQRSYSSSFRKGQKPSFPMSPFCDSMVGDLLADDMKGIALDETKKPPRKKTSNKRNNGGNTSVPHFIRSMTLQPLANKIKNTTLPCFRNLSPTVGEMNGRGRSSGGIVRIPRLSSDSAIQSSDLISQLHGMGSPSPLPKSNFMPRRLRALQSSITSTGSRPSLENLRTSFEMDLPSQHKPHQQGCLKPFMSPHPRNNCFALETPSSRLEIGLETPMPKQVENWGSRPIFGKDWGSSSSCPEDTIKSCVQIFAKSWFTSEFYDEEDLSTKYGMVFDDEDESELFAFYDTDANIVCDNGDNNDGEDDIELASIDGTILDKFPTMEPVSKKIGFVRCDSVGTSALDLLHLDDRVKDFGSPPSYQRRHTMKLQKYVRMSLCVAAASEVLQPNLKRCHRLSVSPTKMLKGTPINIIMDGGSVLSHVLSFLNEGELIHSASLVSTKFADFAADALGNLMLVSVGCDPSLRGNRSDDSLSEVDECDLVETAELQHSSIAKSMKRGWPYLMSQFPWAKFISDGAFKRVFKVWNNRCGAYEALSVMDVDAIDDMGNSDLVGTELAVSVILSSLARRNICPNFVVTRGVFTCQHEPPESLWGCRDESAPCGTAYDGHISHVPMPGQSGNYQYIRMELCENGDVEGYMKNHPNKMLAPCDCRNLLFQMAFALHVAGDRFGLKHYDVKLLNFLLQSAKDPTITDEEHPHVVLRYGIGSHVFRLRMHPSNALIAKLADYGTSVMRSDTDSQPISLGQFTTLENTPPEYLILGNAAEQGYGHDCFGLGLCVLHLFTGHGPYEEILDDVVCPVNLKLKLRKIWKQKSHNVIHSVISSSDENGEDETLYTTLYRYLVLFGIPKTQFGIKKHGKVWSAINTTLLPPKGTRSKKCPDVDVFNKDKKRFSLADGFDERIAAARRRLLDMDGAMEVLLSLVSFDPTTRATPLEVINSRFMTDLVEDDSIIYCKDDIVKSYTAYAT